MNINVTSDIMRPVRTFIDQIEDGDLVLVYFGGLSHRIRDKNYLLSFGDDETETDINFEDDNNDAKRILDRLVERNPSHVTILILDCCNSYVLKSDSTPNSKTYY